MFCCAYSVERSINPSFNLSKHQTHMYSRVGGSESAHDKYLKLLRTRRLCQISFNKEEKEKDEGILKRRIEWVQKYVEKVIFQKITPLVGLLCGCCYLSKYLFTYVNLGWVYSSLRHKNKKP